MLCPQRCNDIRQAADGLGDLLRWLGTEGEAQAVRLAARLRVLLAGEKVGVGLSLTAAKGRVGPNKGMSVAGRRLISQFNAALADDLDTPRAIRVLRAAVRQREVGAARWMLSILAGTASLT